MEQSRDARQARSGSRRIAAERLSTPDQLDQVIRIARLPHWLALGALMTVLAAGIAASILVPVPVTVRGDGILIHVGGMLTVTSDTEGRLLDLQATPGMSVERGQLVALVDQPALEQELRNREAELAEAKSRRTRVEDFQHRSSAAEKHDLDNQRRALVQRHDSATRLLAQLEENLRVETDLSEQGILSRRQLETTRTRINEARDEILGIESEIQSFEKELTGLELDQARELLASELQISDLERRVESAAEELRRRREVRSPYAGRVVEIKVNPGEVIANHAPLFSLLPPLAGGDDSHAGHELMAVLYVPPAEGKKVQLGMDVQLALSSVKREEYGFLIGRVDWVAEVPSTVEGMMRVLQNSQLVQQLSRDHAPFEVRVRLREDPSTPTGYRWSSSTGPDGGIHVGTLCTGDVITRRQRPIAILLPAVGRLFDDDV